MQKFAVAVIGAGPGGYVAAIRCAQLGLRTICIDNYLDSAGKPVPGGTCLNVGCIPSKALLDSSERYHMARHDLAAHGIAVSGVELQLAQMQARKDGVVHSLTTGVATLFLKNKVTYKTGTGRLVSNKQIEVRTPDGGTEVVEADHIIIATGSVPAPLPDLAFDHERIVDSTDALSFAEVPKRLAIIGGGVIALELGSVWQRLGAKVAILQRRDVFLPNVDQDLAAAAQKAFVEQGLELCLGARVKEVKVTAKQVTVHYSDAGGEQKLVADKLLVAAGRRPNTTGLNAEAIGLRLDAGGFITVNDDCRTNIDNIYAIGDVVRGPMLAHKASEEGVAVAERIAGQLPEVNYAVIPSVMYTAPELAWVGRTEQELRQDNIAYRAGRFPFKANGRARAVAHTDGLVKILADAETDAILGVHILGANASELISEVVLAMEFGASAEDLARTVHAHPTLSEAVHEAALAVDGRAIHI